jgi:uncharacterized OsmC-like protein
MEIHIVSATEIKLYRLQESGFTIHADDPELHFGSIQMFITSLAQCTFSVLASYGERFGTSADDITIRMQWTYAERPRRRIAAISMQVHWPSLPESRLDAATRAARYCTLHNTLQEGLEAETLVTH